MKTTQLEKPAHSSIPLPMPVIHLVVFGLVVVGSIAAMMLIAWHGVWFEKHNLPERLIIASLWLYLAAVPLVATIGSPYVFTTDDDTPQWYGAIALGIVTMFFSALVAGVVWGVYEMFDFLGQQFLER